jgi:single-stranded DNA-binding protein
LADTAEKWVVKGMKILIEGSPTANAFLNRENLPVASLRVFANNIEFLSKKDDSPGYDNKDEPVYSLPDSDGTSLTSENIPF